MMQFGVIVTAGAWIIFGLYGWRLSVAGEPEVTRVYDTTTQGWGLGAVAPSSGAPPQRAGDGVANSGDTSTAGTVDDWIKDGFALSGAFPYNPTNHATLKGRIMQESGGDPNAVNNWDINAINGTPSKGLIQIIDPTWRANAPSQYKDFNKYWSKPRINVATSLNYMKAQYGYIVGSNGSGY